MEMKKQFIGLAFPLFLLSAAVQAETVSCMLDNNKVVTATSLATNPIYSYGTSAKLDITLPTGKANSRVYKGSEMFSGGGAQYLAFTNGNYNYVLYDGVGRDWEFQGLRVYKDAEIIMERACKQYGALSLDLDAINAPEGELPY